MTNCDKTYDMGVFNSETNEVENISYPCELEKGHEATSAHVFTKDGTEYPWLDAEQLKAAQARK